MTKLYLIYAESANYAGYGQHFVVEATDKASAIELAYNDMEDYFCEQDSGHIEEEGIEPYTYSCVVSIEEFNKDHKDWVHYMNPTQTEFYTEVRGH